MVNGMTKSIIKAPINESFIKKMSYGGDGMICHGALGSVSNMKVKALKNALMGFSSCNPDKKKYIKISDRSFFGVSRLSR